MPRRIPNDGPSSEHHRQDGYTYRFYNPRSPFQRLIATAITRKSLSERSAAHKMEIPQSTLWLWLHNEKGYPASGRTFKPEIHIPAMARVLGLKEDEIRVSIDQSRMEFHQSSLPDPAASLNALDDLIAILDEMKSRTINRERILRIAKSLRAGANPEAKSHAPASKKPSSRKSGAKKNPPGSGDTKKKRKRPPQK